MEMSFLMSTPIKEKSLLTTVSVMMVITLVGKAMGVLRDRMIAVNYGTGTIEATAFQQANLLPRLFLDVMFAAVFAASFIPVFNQYLENKGKQAAFDLAARFVLLIFMMTATIAILGMIFASPVLILVHGNVAPEVNALATVLLRILFPTLILSGVAFSLTGILHSLGEFNIPAAMSVATNGIILIYFFFFIDYFGIYGLAVAFVIGWGMQLLIQVPFLVKQKFRLRWFKVAPWRDEGIRQIAQLSLPVMVATWVGPVNLWVNSRAASSLNDGGHSFNAIIYANSLYVVIAGLFILSLANVLLPKLSRFAVSEDWDGFASFLRGRLRGLFFLLFPTTFGLMAIAEPLVRLVYEDGLFQEKSVAVTSTALFFFSLGITGFGLQSILSRACYALQDGRAPLITGIIAMAVNLVLSFTLAPIMEIGGIALASSIAISTAAVGLFVMLRRKMPNHSLWTREMTLDAVKMLAMSIIMYLAVRHGTGRLELSRLFAVAVPVGFGATVYMVGCFALKIPETQALLNWLKNKKFG